MRFSYCFSVPGNSWTYYGYVANIFRSPRRKDFLGIQFVSFKSPKIKNSSKISLSRLEEKISSSHAKHLMLADLKRSRTPHVTLPLFGVLLLTHLMQRMHLYGHFDSLRIIGLIHQDKFHTPLNAIGTGL